MIFIQQAPLQIAWIVLAGTYLAAQRGDFAADLLPLSPGGTEGAT
jgi:hypothetical protein